MQWGTLPQCKLR
uniref:Uncharacterized protein n=1 Tax=Anguilla anguilla TaxID=7936 RepID=A0A0E9UEW2_ANGAN